MRRIYPHLKSAREGLGLLLTWAPQLTHRPQVWLRNGCVTACDGCSVGNYRGWPQRPCLALGPHPSPSFIPLPCSPGTPKQLFLMLLTTSPWPKPPDGSSLSFPYCFWCHQPFLSSWSLFLLCCSHEHDPQLIFFLPLQSLLQCFNFFFCPNPFFSATPTRFFSWLPPPPALAYSTFQSLMTFNSHLYEPAALCRKAGSREAAAAAITWPYGGLLLRQWNQRDMFRQGHFPGALVIFLLAELHTNHFLWVYTNQVSPFYAYSGIAALCWYFQLFLSCTGILLELHTKPCKSLSVL